MTNSIHSLIKQNKKYNILYSDPPWTYSDKASAGKRGAGYKYPCMSMAELIELPVKQITADDCALFLWVTMPLLPEGITLLRAWGFYYKTVAFTWVKTNKKAFSLFWGMGNWTRACCELCLLGVKGKPKRIAKNVHSTIVRPIMRHSAKPPEVRHQIVKLMGDLPRLEMFARERMSGWDAMGNEV